MTTRVVTLMWGKAWKKYGHLFADTFCRFWPDDVDLVIVTDKPVPVERGTQIMLCAVPGYVDFRERWKDDPKAGGFDRPRGQKVDAAGRSFRYDAMMWMPQAMAPFAAMDGLEDGDVLVWFDADVETLKPVRDGWADELLGGADVACLQRYGSHSEIGFYAMRINEKTRQALQHFAEFYTSDRVFQLGEWHSAYVWDASIKLVPELKIRNLSPDGKGVQHVWPNTALAEFTAHHKGRRKETRT